MYLQYFSILFMFRFHKYSPVKPVIVLCFIRLCAKILRTLNSVRTTEDMIPSI